MEEIKKLLFKDITLLAGYIGERNIYHYDNLIKAAAFIENEFKEAGYEPVRQEYTAKRKVFWNIVAEKKGEIRPDEIIILGAHYDTHKDSPGANDNGTGVAALLTAARLLKDVDISRTIRFAAFTNEESPFTRTRKMGSRVYAKQCKKNKENIKGMLCLETIGYKSNETGSQRFSLFGKAFPRKGNFIAFIGAKKYKELLERSKRSFELSSNVDTESKMVPIHFPGGWSSDHWSFWKKGYPAVMLTDTAPLRYEHYHTSADSIDKINFDFLTDVTAGVIGMVKKLGG
jgi:Zn-dependent M28 family amino/carboxypeptidase